MRVRAAARSDIGQVRERNEDAYLVEPPLFVVADGMGGHRGGDVASSLAVGTLERLAKSQDLDLGRLVDEIKDANRLVFERSAKDANVQGMGTTITAVLHDANRALVAHIGDSRAYLLRGGSLRQLTEDHTLVQKMVREGKLSSDEANRHPQRSILTRVLGVDSTVAVDEMTVDLEVGDRLLLCSDGLTGMVSTERIEGILAAEKDPQRACDRLVEEANEAGGDDNITVIVLDVESGILGDAPPTGEPASATADEHADRATGGQGALGGRPRGRLLLWAGAVAFVAGLAILGLKLYVDGQWYVGDADGHVAIYRGVPVELLGFELSRVWQTTDVPTTDAEELPTWEGISDGITAKDRQGATEIITQIRRDISRASEGRQSTGESS